MRSADVARCKYSVNNVVLQSDEHDWKQDTIVTEPPLRDDCGDDLVYRLPYLREEKGCTTGIRARRLGPPAKPTSSDPWCLL